MSDTEKEMKGGHAPAVKAGGMRVSQHKINKTGELKLNDDDINNPLKILQPSEKASLIASGQARVGQDCSHSAAIQSFHQKPLPTVDAPHASRPNIIQQPKKQ